MLVQRGEALSAGRLCGQAEKSDRGLSSWGAKADPSMSHTFLTKWLLLGTGSQGAWGLTHLPALPDPGCRSCPSTSPVRYKWAQHRAAERNPLDCGARGYRAPASHLPSQSSPNFPKQTHHDFRHLVMHLLPLLPSPGAI